MPADPALAARLREATGPSRADARRATVIDALLKLAIEARDQAHRIEKGRLRAAGLDRLATRSAAALYALGAFHEAEDAAQDGR